MQAVYWQNSMLFFYICILLKHFLFANRKEYVMIRTFQTEVCG